MKAIFFAMGSRGDVEPALSMAQYLRKKNWTVICALPEQFRCLAEDAEIPFFGLSEKYLEILKSDDVRNVSNRMGTWMERRRAKVRIRAQHKIMLRKVVTQQHDLISKEKPDRVFYNAKITYPLLWGMANPGKTIMISVMPCFIHEVKKHGHIGIDSYFGSFLNRYTYWINQLYFSLLVKKSTAPFHFRFSRDCYRIKNLKKSLLNKEKIFYTVSPTLFPNPGYWPDQAKVVGYFERKKTSNWKPFRELVDFLNKYNKILFISFGSMTNANPTRTSEIIINVIKKHEIPAIIGTCWGGLERPEIVPEHTLFVEDIPFEWLFPKMYGVIHHGGSGTTHAAHKYGCVSLSIPHMADQFFWNKWTSNLGTGPLGVSIHKINEKKIVELILDLYSNPEYKHKAVSIANKMNEETVSENLLNIV